MLAFSYIAKEYSILNNIVYIQWQTSRDLGEDPGPSAFFSFSFRPNWGPQGAKKKIFPRPGPH